MDMVDYNRFRKEHLRVWKFNVNILGRQTRVNLVSRQIEERLPLKNPEVIKILERWCVIQTHNKLIEAMIYNKLLDTFGRVRLI